MLKPDLGANDRGGLARVGDQCRKVCCSVGAEGSIDRLVLRLIEAAATGLKSAIASWSFCGISIVPMAGLVSGAKFPHVAPAKPSIC
jgi:hypothetical protein